MGRSCRMLIAKSFPVTDFIGIKIPRHGCTQRGVSGFLGNLPFKLTIIITGNFM